MTSNFPDEVGSLALSIEQMRTQLQDLFRTLEGDRDRLERLLDRLNEGVLLVDRDLKIEFANDRAHELLGVGDSPRGTRGSDSPTTAAIRSIAVDLFSIGLPGHLRVVTDDKTLLMSGIPPSEGSDSAIVVVLDETEREHNERVQREFATNAAHELRTPLASIVTAVEMLRTGAKDDRSARDAFLDVIAREADRLTRLTRALLVLARAELRDEPPRLAQVELAPLLEQVAASLPARDGVGISVDCQPALAIATDTDLLEQALSSVATNAVQNTDHGRCQPTRRATERLGRDRDRGHRARHPGGRSRTGSSSASIAPETARAASGSASRSPTSPSQRSAGRSASTSQPSSGTTVRIVLPAGEAQMSPRILIVDDEPSLVQGLSYALDPRGVRGRRRDRRRGGRRRRSFAANST